MVLYKIAKAIPINVHIITTKIFAVANPFKFHNSGRDLLY